MDILPSEYYRKLTKETIACPLCSSNENRALCKRDRYGMGVKTVFCKKCGMIFLNPRPTASEMDRFYRIDYRRFYESIDIPTVEYIESGPYMARASFVIGVVSETIPLLFQGEILDIGCAEGTLLRMLGEKYPASIRSGFEPNREFSQFAANYSGVSVHCLSFEEFFSGTRGNSRRYELITLTHVLEHLLHPIDALEHIRELLSSNGCFYVEVPNVVDERSKGIRHIHLGHTLSFTPSTLRYALDKAGFEIVEFYKDVLPAETPSMSALCRARNKVEPLLPYPDNIRLEIDVYRDNVCGTIDNREMKRRMKQIEDRLKLSCRYLRSLLSG